MEWVGNLLNSGEASRLKELSGLHPQPDFPGVADLLGAEYGESGMSEDDDIQEIKS